MKRLKNGLVFSFILALCSGILASITWNSVGTILNEIKQPLDMRTSTHYDDSDFYSIWGGSVWDKAFSIALDGSGNIYITGETRSFGEGEYDAFIVKFNSSGIQQWNITWGGSDYDYGNDIILDDLGNIYITGVTYNFGAGEVDAFIAKFDSSGNSVMNITWGGSDIEGASGIILDVSGNIYITGSTSSFGAGEEDAFIAKFDSSGNSLMNITWGGSDKDWGEGIALDDSGNIYITGLTDYGTWWGDAFIAKFNSSGDSIMNITWGGNDQDYGESIALNDSGNIYITGYTESFGAGEADAFIAKFNSSGNSVMNITWGGSDDDQGKDIILDGLGNIYITGYTYSFGSSHGDAYVAKFNSHGNPIRIVTWGGVNHDGGYGIALDDSGNTYITGHTFSFTDGWGDACVVKNPSNVDIYKEEEDDGYDDVTQEEVIPDLDLSLLIAFYGSILLFGIVIILSVILAKKH